MTMKFMKKSIALVLALTTVASYTLFASTGIRALAASNYTWNTPFTNPYGTLGDKVTIYADPGVTDTCEPTDGANWSMVSRADWANWKADSNGSSIKNASDGVHVSVNDYSAIDPNNGNQCATAMACWMKPVSLDGASIALNNFMYKTGAVGSPTLNIEYNIEPRFNHGVSFSVFGIRINYTLSSGQMVVYVTTPERNEKTNVATNQYYSWNSPNFSSPSLCTVYNATTTKNLTSLSSNIVAVKTNNVIVAYKVYVNGTLLTTLCKNDADKANYTNGVTAWDLFNMLEDNRVNNQVYVMAGMYDTTYWYKNPYYQNASGGWDTSKSSLRTGLCSYTITQLNGIYFGTASNYKWSTGFSDPYGGSSNVIIKANPGVKDACEPVSGANWSMVSRYEWSNWSADNDGSSIISSSDGVDVSANDYTAIDPTYGNQCATAVACWMTPVNLGGASIAFNNFRYTPQVVGTPNLEIEYNIEPRFNHNMSAGAYGIRITYVPSSGAVLMYLTTPERNEWTKAAGATGAGTNLGWYSWDSPYFSLDKNSGICSCYSGTLATGLTSLSSDVVAVKENDMIVAYQVYLNGTLIKTLCNCTTAADASKYTNGMAAWDLFKMLNDNNVNNKVYVMAGMYDTTYWLNNAYYKTGTSWDPEKGKNRLNLCSYTITELNGTYFGNNAPDTSATTTYNSGALTVSITNPKIGYKYQIWNYAKVAQDAFSDDASAPDQYQWVLYKSYENHAMSAVITNPTTDENGRYRTMIVELDSSGNTTNLYYDITPEQAGAVTIGKVLFNGKATGGVEAVDGTASDVEIPIKIVAGGATAYSLTYTGSDGITQNDLTSGLIVADDGSYATENVNFGSGNMKPGSYTFTAKAINGTDSDTQTFVVRVYSASTDITYASITSITPSVTNNIMSLSLGGSLNSDNFRYSFVLSEPGTSSVSESGTSSASPFTCRNYSGKSYTFTGKTLHPGVYEIYASAKRSDASGFDDAIVSYFPYNLRSQYKITGTAVTNAGTGLAADPQNAIKDTTYQIEATSGGSDTQYSFWRNDARGWVMIKGWSSSNVLSWKPAYIGDYVIQVRAKGLDAGSYEDSKNIDFTVTSDGLNKAAGTVTLSYSASPTAHTPVTLNAAVSGDTNTNDHLLYRFDASDTNLGSYVLQAYSPNATCTWVPRKAGDYTITVKVINQNSFGDHDIESQGTLIPVA